MSRIGARKRNRLSREIQTRERVAKTAKQSLQDKLLRWSNVAFSVAYLVQQVREWIEQDIPTIIRFTLRKIGLSYAADDPLTMAGFTAVVSRDSGVPFRDLSDKAITIEDIEAFSLTAVREATGLEITTLEYAQLRTQLQQMVIDTAQENAPPNRVVTAKLVGQMRNAARDAYRDGLTLSLGAPFSQRLYRWSHREAVRTYGRAHIQVWEWDDLLRKKKTFGRYRTVPIKRIKQAWRHNNRVWRKMLKGEPLVYGDWIDWINQDGPASPYSLWTLTEFERYRKRNKIRPLNRKGGRRRNWWGPIKPIR